MARYGKLNSKMFSADGKKGFLHQALLFLLFFVISFLILTVIVFYGPFRQRSVDQGQTLRFSAEDLVVDVSDVEPFSDLSEGDFGYTEAMYLKKLGVLRGYDDGTFLPEKSMNRAEFVKVVHESMHVYPHKLRNSYCYDDVKNDWYAPYVCSASLKGWVSSEKDEFVPDRNITLAEVVKIIMVASDIEVEEQIDGPWYEPYMMAAEDMQWFENANITDTDPERDVTRSEVAGLLYYPVRTGLLK